MKVWAKTQEFSEGKFLVVRRDGTVPAWPHYVLGARDPAAPAAMRAYADEAQRLTEEGEADYDPEYVASLRELADDFDRYREAAGPGDPDAPPHRTDDPAVIAAMTGLPSTISVRPGPNKPKGKAAEVDLEKRFEDYLQDPGRNDG